MGASLVLVRPATRLDLTLNAGADLIDEYWTPRLARFILVVIVLLLLFWPDDLFESSLAQKTAQYFVTNSSEKVDQRAFMPPRGTWKPVAPISLRHRLLFDDVTGRRVRDDIAETESARQFDHFQLASVTPEPSSWVAMIIGLAFVGGRLRLRRLKRLT